MLDLSRSLLLAGLIGLAPLSAKADDAVLLENDASRCEIFRVISADVPPECRLGKTRSLGQPRGLGQARGIRIHGNDQGTATTNAGRPTPAATGTAEPQSFSLAMRIQFKFDSAELTPEAKATLGQIAQVLQDDLMRDKVILLEGHADASGGDNYNLDLSTRRAGSVRNYLVTTYGIAGERLRSVGKGEMEPFDATDPTSSVNRRVEFTNLSDQAAFQQ
jgi:outer membrane protein OmpA-like peptidoglycan-associated protein